MGRRPVKRSGDVPDSAYIGGIALFKVGRRDHSEGFLKIHRH
jgi:hypothetical protein